MLGVVRHVGRLLDGCRGPKPFELVNDGDLLLLIDRMIQQRGLDTVCISKVKGHAVLLSLMLVVIYLGFVVGGILSFLTSIVSSLLFLVLWSIMMIEVVLLLTLLSGLLVLLVKGAGWSLRFVTVPFCLDLLVFGTRIGFRFQLLLSVLRILLFGLALLGFWFLWVSFLNSLHWPVGDLDLGVGGVSYVELLIMYELWAGEGLFLGKAHPRYLRPGRPISVSAVPVGPGTDFWRSCRFIGALMRSLCLLPGGLRMFVPCSVLVLIIVGFVTLVGRSVVNKQQQKTTTTTTKNNKKQQQQQQQQKQQQQKTTTTTKNNNNNNKTTTTTTTKQQQQQKTTTTKTTTKTTKTTKTTTKTKTKTTTMD